MTVYVTPFEVGLGTGQATFLDARSGVKYPVSARRLTLIGAALYLPGMVVEETDGLFAVTVAGSPPVWVERVLLRELPEVAA
jgi:hypothetical protein